MSNASPPPTDLEDERARFFEEIAGRSCRELFGQYGVTLNSVDEEAQPISPKFLFCSVISFSGRRLRGTLVLAMTEDLPAKTSPLGTAVPTRDWVGELSNQLLGRVKIELLRHGVEISLNLPAVLRGEHLAPLPRRALKPVKFAASTGAVAIWIEVEMEPGFQFGSATGDTEGAAHSGAALLFD